MKKLIFIFILISTLISCGSKEVEYSELVTPQLETFTTHTYYLKWIGDESDKTNTLKELAKQKCWTLKDVIAASQKNSTDCHEFLEYKNLSEIQGPYKKVGSSFLIEVRVEKNDVYKIQFYAKNKNKLRRILKPTKLINPDDFAETLKRLTYK